MSHLGGSDSEKLQICGHLRQKKIKKNLKNVHYPNLIMFHVILSKKQNKTNNQKNKENILLWQNLGNHI